MTITITIDNAPHRVKADENLVDAAASVGIYIPTLCYQRGRPCLGTCRLCTVKIKGHPAAACTLPVHDNMVVEIHTPELTDMRRALVELLFAEGNHNCPSCEKSGRCELQAVGYETGMVVSRFPYRYPVRSREERPKRLWLERDRCIFCLRCVEFIRDRESDQKIFTIHQRGRHARIDVDVALADKMSAKQVSEAAELCPVGCIIEKGVGYDTPIGQRKFELKSIRQRTLEGEKR